MKTKTRIAYVKHSNGNISYLGDTVNMALKANMLVKDYEKRLIEINPQLEIKIAIEEI